MTRFHCQRVKEFSGLGALSRNVQPPPSRTSRESCHGHIVSEREREGESFPLSIFAQITDSLKQSERRGGVPHGGRFSFHFDRSRRRPIEGEDRSHQFCSA